MDTTGLTKRTILGWSVGMFAALGLLWATAMVMWPVCRVRKAVPVGTWACDPYSDDLTLDWAVPWDGGIPCGEEDRWWWPTAANVELYVKMPNFIAPEKQRAVSLLGSLNGGVPALARILHHRNPEVRIAAAFFLTRSDRQAREAIPAITQALEDEHYAVRCFAARALGLMGRAESIAPLSLALQDKVENVRLEARKALRRIIALREARRFITSSPVAGQEAPPLPHWLRKALE